MALERTDWHREEIVACLGIGQVDPVPPDMLPLQGLDLRQPCLGSTLVRFAGVPSGR